MGKGRLYFINIFPWTINVEAVVLMSGVKDWHAQRSGNVAVFWKLGIYIKYGRLTSARIAVPR